MRSVTMDTTLSPVAMVGALELAKSAIIIRVNIMMKASTTSFNSK